MAASKLYKPVIRIDTREHQPWKFEYAFKSGLIKGTIVGTINAGDYIIEDVPGLVVVERKKTFMELYSNFIPNTYWDRFEREMVRLNHYKHKYIIIEQTWPALFDTETFRFVHKNKHAAGSIVMKKLFTLQDKYNVRVIAAGNCGEQTCLTVLLKHFDDYRKELALSNS